LACRASAVMTASAMSRRSSRAENKRPRKGIIAPGAPGPHTADVDQLPATHVVLGAGPVGRSVLAALDARGVTPAVVTRSGTAVPGAQSAVADISDPAQAAVAVAGAQVVFQCTSPAYHKWPAQFPALQASVVDAAASAGALVRG